MSVKTPATATPENGAFNVSDTDSLFRPRRALRGPRIRIRAERMGVAATAAVPVLGLLLCIAGTRTQPLLPATIQLAPPASLTGPFRYIGFSLSRGEAAAALVLLVGAYLLAVWRSADVPTRVVIWAIVALNVIVLLGPPLFSTDVFSYQAYARMFTIYHTNPYLSGPSAVGVAPYPPGFEQLLGYVGFRWTQTASVYGPLFTFVSGAFAATSISISQFTFKLIAVASSAGTMWLIWRSARLRGVEPGRAIAIFGLNPLVTLYGVGGGHNDLLMLVVMTAGVYALLSRRPGWSGGLISASAAIKLTGGIVLPFALVSELENGSGRSRRTLILGAGAVTAVVAAASFWVFGTGILHLLGTLQSVQDTGRWQSVPGFFFQVAQVPIPGVFRVVVDVGFVGAVLWLLDAVRRKRMDWIEGAAWATFAMLACAWYLLPWYTCWMLPLVALSRSRRLLSAAIAMTLIGSAIMVSACF